MLRREFLKLVGAAIVLPWSAIKAFGRTITAPRWRKIDTVVNGWHVETRYKVLDNNNCLVDYWVMLCDEEPLPDQPGFVFKDGVFEVRLPTTEERAMMVDV